MAVIWSCWRLVLKLSPALGAPVISGWLTQDGQPASLLESQDFHQDSQFFTSANYSNLNCGAHFHEQSAFDMINQERI